ncbi:galactose-1-epimerase [Hymenobacter sp. HMF4947]|uniref:Aldose 1-epimerase n=1 Tax=Hymenobacter ginkgonis TaxID=2682976 RepID=A0A7K1TES8_9BACT|nr:aldose epimerase family protein [Hymenobacter ginkgonis]MVN76631.1 galactose-1-epimerase [Hymenobacter ginkgonis]
MPTPSAGYPTPSLFTLQNGRGMQATISARGGTLTKLLVPDKSGVLGNVVLGFDDPATYASEAYESKNIYFGALIGRYANRIRHGQFTLDEQTYSLPINNGPNSLHGGPQGFDKQQWAAQPGTSADGPTLVLHYQSPAGEEGYPGTLSVTAVYTLTEANVLRISYSATTDQPTVLNLTNHSYFNLDYGLSSNILDHELRLLADRYTVVDNTAIPTGELRGVGSSPFDFRAAHRIGERMAQVPGGYDHNWVLHDYLRPHSALAAEVYAPLSGRTMQVHTDQPGVQFYAGNFLDGSLQGHGGIAYGPNYGFALETQHFPDSPNQPSFPTTVLRPGETFESTTEYHFGVRE